MRGVRLRTALALEGTQYDVEYLVKTGVARGRMYRIRLQSGEEAVYKTVEELAAAVTSGVISPTAEVFHKAGNRWLPINTHPDYRAVITGKRQALQQAALKDLHQASSGPAPSEHPQSPGRSPTRKAQPAIQFEVIGPAGSPEPPRTQTPPTVQTQKLELEPPSVERASPEVVPVVARTVPSAPKVEILTPAPDRDEVQAQDLAPEPEIITLEPTGGVEQPALEEEITAALPPGVTRPGRPVLAIVLGVTGLLSAAGLAAVLLTRPSRPSGSSSIQPAAPAVEPTAPASKPLADSTPIRQSPAAAAKPPTGKPALAVRADTGPALYPAPSKPLLPGSKPSPPGPLAPPPRTVSRLGTTVNKMPSYYEAYADARAEMDEGLTYVDFRRVFAPYRFGSADSIRTTRRMVAAAGNILRVYRGREVMLEQTYRPGEPEGKGSLREPFEVAEASRGLLADVDSLFAILVAQEGEVKYRDNALSFRNNRAAQAYSQMRRQIMQTLTYLGDPAESADRVTMPRLLRGFGSDRPPPAR